MNTGMRRVVFAWYSSYGGDAPTASFHNPTRPASSLTSPARIARTPAGSRSSTAWFTGRVVTPPRLRGAPAGRAGHARDRVRARGGPDPHRPRDRRGPVRLRVLRPAEAPQRRRLSPLQGAAPTDARAQGDERVGALRRRQPERYAGDVLRDARGDRAGQRGRLRARRRQQSLDERPE